MMHTLGYPPDVAGHHHASHNMDVVHNIHHVHSGPFQGDTLPRGGHGTLCRRERGTLPRGGRKTTVRQRRLSLICGIVCGVVLLTVAAVVLFSGIGLLLADVGDLG